jgi:hypothetical protein
MNDEFGTFYKIKILYKNTIVIPNYRTTVFEKAVEYHLSRKNNCYYYYKFTDNKLVYMSNEFRSNHMVKNIYYIMQNIEKLNDGKIKKYHIFYQLELEVLCDYLKKNNILHQIKIEYSKPGTNVECFTYDEYNEKTNLSTYFNQTRSDYERNKIIKLYKLYIQVYKGFENIFDKKYLYQNSHIEKSKFRIYLYPVSYIRKVNIDTISSSLGPNTHNIKTNLHTPSKVISPWINAVN